jgi:uncharacterized protein YkwD
MKKRPVLHQLASFCIAASVFFSAATIANANTFTPPQQLTYPGLTFSAPLTFTTRPLSETTSLISFTAHNKLVITKDTKKKQLEAIVITPTLAAIQTTVTATPQTSPTIDVQATATELATEPTSTPTPEPTTATTAAPTNYTPDPQSNPGGLNAEDLFGMVNAYRASQGLPAFQEDAKTCSLAQQRAPIVGGEIASGNMHAGLKAMNLPYWNTENIISMNSDQAAFNWWINDPIHHDAIVSHNVYSCVACSGNSCAEEFTSYQPK